MSLPTASSSSGIPNHASASKALWARHRNWRFCVRGAAIGERHNVMQFREPALRTAAEGDHRERLRQRVDLEPRVFPMRDIVLDVGQSVRLVMNDPTITGDRHYARKIVFVIALESAA